MKKTTQIHSLRATRVMLLATNVIRQNINFHAIDIYNTIIHIHSYIYSIIIYRHVINYKKDCIYIQLLCTKQRIFLILGRPISQTQTFSGDKYLLS